MESTSYNGAAYILIVESHSPPMMIGGVDQAENKEEEGEVVGWDQGSS